MVLRTHASWWLSIVVLLVACNGGGGGPRVTQIDYFRADALSVPRGTLVTLSWSARNPGTFPDFPSCSLSRRYEGGEAQAPEPVSCVGSLTETPVAPASAGYARYQLNVLRHPYDEDADEQYEYAGLEIELRDPEDGDPDTAITRFEIDPTRVLRGEEVRLEWRVRNPGTHDDIPSCSLTRHFDGQPAAEPTPIACEGSLQEVPAASPGAANVRYQLNALKDPFDPSDPFITAVVTVTLDEPDPDPDPDVLVSIDPASARLTFGATRSFTAEVTGTTDTRITWSATCGAISGSGSTITYTAPNTVGTCVITATSVVDEAAWGEATVTVVPGVSVLLQPSSMTLPVNGSGSFTAEVTGATDTSVTWSASCGSVSGSGSTITYTAPNTAGTCTITATSVADGNASASADVTVFDASLPGFLEVDKIVDRRELAWAGPQTTLGASNVVSPLVRPDTVFTTTSTITVTNGSGAPVYGVALRDAVPAELGVFTSTIETSTDGGATWETDVASYDSLSHTITWDYNQDPGLSLVDVGDAVALRFQVYARHKPGSVWDGGNTDLYGAPHVVRGDVPYGHPYCVTNGARSVLTNAITVNASGWEEEAQVGTPAPQQVWAYTPAGDASTVCVVHAPFLSIVVDGEHRAWADASDPNTLGQRTDVFYVGETFWYVYSLVAGETGAATSVVVDIGRANAVTRFDAPPAVFVSADGRTTWTAWSSGVEYNLDTFSAGQVSLTAAELEPGEVALFVIPATAMATGEQTITYRLVSYANNVLQSLPLVAADATSVEPGTLP